jgi:hypothetical protein
MGVLITMMVMLGLMCGVSAHHNHVLHMNQEEIQKLENNQIPVIEKYDGVQIKNLSQPMSLDHETK